MSAIRKAKEHFDLLHSKPIATSIVWTKARQEGQQWHKFEGSPQLELFGQLDKEHDVFLTPNEFRGWRRFDLLRSLKACYVDIDKQLSRYELDEQIKASNLPHPSAIVSSGRGWHLYWLLDSTPAQALPVWQELQDRLINTFEADKSARDCARVLRLVGSINSKNGAEVWGEVFDPIPWKFHDFCNEVLGYREQKKAKVYDFNTQRAEAGHKPKKARKASIYSWWHLVYQDLATIASSYPKGIPEGERNNFLFLVSVAMSWFANPEAIREALADKANKWTAGLTKQEIEQACKCSLDRLEQHQQGKKITWQGKELDPRYFFKRTTLYSKLKGLIKPEVEDKLRAIIDEETRAKRRAERERAREPRDRVAEGRYKRHYEGLNKLKPWEAEGISRTTWYSRRKAQKDD